MPSWFRRCSARTWPTHDDGLIAEQIRGSASPPSWPWTAPVIRPTRLCALMGPRPTGVGAGVSLRSQAKRSQANSQTGLFHVDQTNPAPHALQLTLPVID